VEAFLVRCPSPVPITLEMHEAARRIAEKHGYQIYDALVVAAALDAGCDVLYSEDFQDGQRIEGEAYGAESVWEAVVSSGAEAHLIKPSNVGAEAPTPL
jgi:hypothetical protein